jgi:B12-binding domain/radical SAM domain protein
MLKKFALVACLSSKNWYSFAPLLANLETTDLLDKYHVVFLEKRSNSAIKKIVSQFETIIFSYSFYTPEVPFIATEIKRIKEEFPSQQFIFLAGGPHASGSPKQTLNMGFNLVVKGEGERTFSLLLDRLSKNEDYSDLEGVCFIRDNQVHISDNSQLIELDAYPTCSKRFELHPPIEITRGCPFGCKYCQVSYLFGRIMRHRSIERIIEIITEYIKTFKGPRITDIRFISPNSFAYGSTDGKTPNPLKISELLHSIAQTFPDTRIFFASFPSEGRPEFITPSILEQITPLIANKYISFGAQSGSDRILKAIGRQHTVQDIMNAASAIIDVRLLPLVDFIVGLPDETPEDQAQTLGLIKKLIRLKAKIRIHYFMPLAGTPFENKRAVPIAPAIFSEFGRLAKKGQLIGNLNTQIQNSIRIQHFFESIKN